MNRNKIYFVQVRNSWGARKCFVVSAPRMSDAIVYIQDKWCDDDEDVVHTDRITNMVDTDAAMNGLTYIKMHN